MLIVRAEKAVLTALLVLALSCDDGGSDLPLQPAREEEKDAEIFGWVRVEGVGLPEVGISLAGPESRVARTDADGGFSFADLARGTYTVSLERVDTAALRFPVAQQTVTALSGEPVRVEFDGTWAPEPPQAPTGLLAAAHGPDVVGLSWTDESDDETGFGVERSVDPDGGWAEVGRVGTDTAVFVDSGLEPVTAYTYRVRACNEAGCSSYSEEAQATTEDVPPAAPVDLTARADGSAAIDLRWADRSDNEAGFRLERRGGETGSWIEVAATGADTEAFTDSGLSPGTVYTYRVRACNPVGCSAYSNEAGALTSGSPGPNLLVSGLHITQSVQTLGGHVPLLAAKPGFLRVFVLAGEENSLEPEVRVRLYQDGSLVRTDLVQAPSTGVPTVISEASLAYSWNLPLPEGLIRPGLSVLADVDPSDRFPEVDEGDNVFPADGLPLALDVGVAPTFEVTFVPVRQTATGLVGEVTSGSAGGFLTVTERMLPIPGSDVRIHAEYVTDAPALERDNGNGAWGTVLSELYALHVAEGSGEHYYGVVRTSYTSGVAGMGYLGYPVAVGWDHLPSGAGVAAHEWGHNWNRQHAPGCGVSSPDPGFPYSEGRIGVWGMDVEAEALKSPSTYFDFMGYCSPEWVSDYTYEGIMGYRQARVGPEGMLSGEPVLLVWGRVDGERIVLEPTFSLVSRPALPTGQGDLLLEGLGDDGSTLFRRTFAPVPVPDAGSGEGHFAFALPLRSLPAGRLAGLRVSGEGKRPAVLESFPEAGPGEGTTPTLRSAIRDGSFLELRWETAAYPMALVRDPATGEILSFARGGTARIPVRSGEVELILSRGLGSSEPIRVPMR